MKYSKTHKLIDDTQAGIEIPENSNVSDFRGDICKFEYITRVPGDGSSTTGKILIDGRELYPSVINAKIVVR